MSVDGKALLNEWDENAKKYHPYCIYLEKVLYEGPELSYNTSDLDKIRTGHLYGLAMRLT